GAQRRQDGARGRSSGNPHSGSRAGRHAHAHFTRHAPRPHRSDRAARILVASVVAALFRGRSPVLMAAQRPVAVIIGAPAWADEATRALTDAGLQTLSFNDRERYIDDLIDAHPALIL